VRFVGILELISEISRILSFSFRLFGNIFAGEIVLATMAFLAAFFIPLPFYVLELFVGFVAGACFHHVGVGVLLNGDSWSPRRGTRTPLDCGCLKPESVAFQKLLTSYRARNTGGLSFDCWLDLFTQTVCSWNRYKSYRLRRSSQWMQRL
jgi:hypothetical protein